MRLLLLAPLLLVGCAITPEQMAERSNIDVCRFTLGGPFAKIADAEVARRSLDCAPLYPVIAARMNAQNAATQNMLRNINQPAPPRPINCTSYNTGYSIQTQCN